MAAVAETCLDKFLDISAKILCLLVVLGQSAALDSYFFTLDHSGGSPYIWVVLDIIVLLCWSLSLLLPACLKKPTPPEGGVWHQVVAVIEELKYAYLSWLLYAVVLCFKLNHMFSYLAEHLTARPTLNSSTAVKLLISLAGIAFLLLVYSHHKEIRGENYRQVMEKISLSACLDILDCLMLLNILFIDESGLLLPFRLDRTVRTFSCICILLPVFPLLVMRILQHPRGTLKWYRLSIITQTALYFLLVNVPLFSIRLHLWITHDADISTFFTKNVIMLLKGAVDIVREAYGWYRDTRHPQRGTGPVVGEDDETHGHMLVDTKLGGGASTTGGEPDEEPDAAKA